MSSAEAATMSGRRRPHSNLLAYYLFTSVLWGPLLPLVAARRYFHYRTLRYTFDDEGVSVRWGVLFRSEIRLNYSRIQDIHLSSNLLERWLGLAKVELQTASGSAEAEITVEGLKEYEQVRDFLYGRMQASRSAPSDDGGWPRAAADGHDWARLIEGLRAVTRELAAIRRLVERGAKSGRADAPEAPRTEAGGSTG